MLFRLEVLPLRLHLAVQLQLRITLGILETKLLIDGDKVDISTRRWSWPGDTNP